MKTINKAFSWVEFPYRGQLVLLFLCFLLLGLTSLIISTIQGVLVLTSVTMLFCFVTCANVEKSLRLSLSQVYILLVLLQVLSILFFQQLPQWQDAPSDSFKYHLHGSALAMHLHGEIVDANIYDLQLVQGDKYWSTDSILSFPYIVGSTHFLYQAYLGFIYYFLPNPDPQVAILSHASILATLPILTFVLARHLYFHLNVAILAGFLVVIDTRFTVNASWLLKDTLLTFAMLFFMSCLARLTTKGAGKQNINLICMAASLIAIFCLRSHVALTVCFLVSGFSIYKIMHKDKSYLRVFIAIIFSFYISGLLHVSVWDFGSPLTYLRASIVHFSSISASLDMLISSAEFATSKVGDLSQSDMVTDPVAETFYRAASDTPVLAVVQAISRTLFAPYPWAGLEGTAYDLYFPGMVLWILGLPFLIIGILNVRNNARTIDILLMMLVLIVIAIYIASFGEFSTRQRQFLTPLFWIWISNGIVCFHIWLNRRLPA